MKPNGFRNGGRVIKLGGAVVGTGRRSESQKHDSSDGPFKIDYVVEWDDGTTTEEDSMSLDYAPTGH